MHVTKVNFDALLDISSFFSSFSQRRTCSFSSGASPLFSKVSSLVYSPRDLHRPIDCIVTQILFWYYTLFIYLFYFSRGRYITRRGSRLGRRLRAAERTFSMDRRVSSKSCKWTSDRFQAQTEDVLQIWRYLARVRLSFDCPFAGTAEGFPNFVFTYTEKLSSYIVTFDRPPWRGHNGTFYPIHIVIFLH